MQRVFGHDVLILPNMLDDTRSLPRKLFKGFAAFFVFFPLGTYFLIRRGRKFQFSDAALNFTKEAARNR